VAGGQGRLQLTYGMMPSLAGSIVGVRAAPLADAPIFSQPAGTYGPSVVIALFSATSGVNFYYTLDGTTPTTSSSPYTSPIVLNSL
jgi:hypothetical protein